MNAAKLNRHFTIELSDGGYTWVPTTPVLYDFGEGKRIQIICIHQEYDNISATVITMDGCEIQVTNMEILSGKLRYPHKIRKSVF